MCVDRNLDIEFPGELFDRGKRFVRRRAHHHRHSAGPGVLEMAPQHSKIFMLQVDVATADRQSRFLKVASGFGDFVGCGRVRLMKFFHADISNTQLLIIDIASFH